MTGFGARFGAVFRARLPRLASGVDAVWSRSRVAFEVLRRPAWQGVVWLRSPAAKKAMRLGIFLLLVYGCYYAIMSIPEDPNIARVMDARDLMYPRSEDDFISWWNETHIPMNMVSHLEYNVTWVDNPNGTHPLVGQLYNNVCLSGNYVYWFGDENLPNWFFPNSIWGTREFTQLAESTHLLKDAAMRGKLVWYPGFTATVDIPFHVLNMYHYLEAVSYLYSSLLSVDLDQAVNRILMSTDLSNPFTRGSAYTWVHDLNSLLFDNILGGDDSMIGLHPDVEEANKCVCVGIGSLGHRLGLVVHPIPPHPIPPYFSNMICFEKLFASDRHGSAGQSFWFTQEDAIKFRKKIISKLSPRLTATRSKSGRPSVLVQSRRFRRRLMNEFDVYSYLRYELGLDATLATIEVGTPMATQMALWASADIILSPVGAGLTNMIFAKPHATIVMYAPPGLHDHDWYLDAVRNSSRPLPDPLLMWLSPYPVLANFLGFQYYMLSPDWTFESLYNMTSASMEYSQAFWNVTARECEIEHRYTCYHPFLTLDFKVDMGLLKTTVHDALQHYYDIFPPKKDVVVAGSGGSGVDAAKLPDKGGEPVASDF